MAKLDDQDDTEKWFSQDYEKDEMCKFWFYLEAKLDDEDDMDRWFYHPLWKKSFSFEFK